MVENQAQQISNCSCAGDSPNWHLPQLQWFFSWDAPDGLQNWGVNLGCFSPVLTKHGQTQNIPEHTHMSKII
jgi:hypothetical protein